MVSGKSDKTVGSTQTEQNNIENINIENINKTKVRRNLPYVLHMMYHGLVDMTKLHTKKFQLVDKTVGCTQTEQNNLKVLYFTEHQI